MNQALTIIAEFVVFLVGCSVIIHMLHLRDRKIRELEEEIASLRVKSHKNLDEYETDLRRMMKELESERKKTRRDVFIAEKGLLPCESPACQMCKRAVLYDGQIAGCSKGIVCTDFEQKPYETPSTQIVPIPFPAQPYYGTCFHFPF